jgi:hypothetical protein
MHGDFLPAVCKYCDAFVCDLCEEIADPEEGDRYSLMPTCGECDAMVCQQCSDEHPDVLRSCETCLHALCRECERKPGANYTRCDGCGVDGCNECVTCRGPDGQDITICEWCAAKADELRKE